MKRSVPTGVSPEVPATPPTRRERPDYSGSLQGAPRRQRDSASFVVAGAGRAGVAPVSNALKSARILRPVLGFVISRLEKMMYIIQCSSCQHKTKARDIVNLINKHTDSSISKANGGYLRCESCNQLG